MAAKAGVDMEALRAVVMAGSAASTMFGRLINAPLHDVDRHAQFAIRNARKDLRYYTNMTEQLPVASLSFRNVSFSEGDPTNMKFERRFDAVIGRYVLMFQPDPAAMLRGITGHVRPGGVVVFHEPDWASARSFPSVPTYDQCCQCIVETLRLSDADPRMGKMSDRFRLAQTAGLGRQQTCGCLAEQRGSGLPTWG